MSIQVEQYLMNGLPDHSLALHCPMCIIGNIRHPSRCSSFPEGQSQINEFYVGRDRPEHGLNYIRQIIERSFPHFRCRWLKVFQPSMDPIVDRRKRDHEANASLASQVMGFGQN